MKLYDYILSPSCYRVRLMAALAGIKLELRPVDFHPGAEHRGPELLALNPSGTIPILTEGDLVLTQSTAMLTYIAATHAPEWLGDDKPAMRAQVAQWLAFAQRLTDSAGAARLHDMLQMPGDIVKLRLAATRTLRELEAAISAARRRGRIFLAGDRPTIADIACFPYVALAPDGGLPLDAYPSIRLWMRAVRGLPGFVEMPGIHRLHELMPEPGPQPDVVRKESA
ncbi:glutathione S-transferase family protein [Paracoccus aestuariivivens]|uniref:Glutathione S-transferase family protein n=1 Tax=Paracoccus aestuariivivens TaxID=1820333 RepID=A0A6L6JCD5_9RHOB|nr:glutathione S-transferase family protein [Paracoccus aestuariivivens]MTH79630.1 glutathione S-transferase family protein [Paracoccus aestuariivivens]